MSISGSFEVFCSIDWAVKLQYEAAYQNPIHWLPREDWSTDKSWLPSAFTFPLLLYPKRPLTFQSRVQNSVYTGYYYVKKKKCCYLNRIWRDTKKHIIFMLIYKLKLFNWVSWSKLTFWMKTKFLKSQMILFCFSGS